MKRINNLEYVCWRLAGHQNIRYYGVQWFVLFLMLTLPIAAYVPLFRLFYFIALVGLCIGLNTNDKLDKTINEHVKMNTYKTLPDDPRKINLI